MEAETANTNQKPGVLNLLLPAILPVLLISIGYVDPGKWAAIVEGGAHFGTDLVALMLLFNFAAILCHYLSARIGVVTGSDLAQICSREYDKYTCVLLGVQTELSVILLDLTMVLGIAHGLNLLLGVYLSTSIFLAAADAVFYPFFAGLQESKANFLCISMAGVLFVSYVLGVLISQPETPVSVNGMLTKLSGESTFTVMSLLGANIMPHNLYLHSSIIRHYQGWLKISKDTVCHYHFFAISCIFCGIYLVNFVMMNSAANVFHSTGLVLTTFQDVMDQVFRNPVAPFVFLLVLFLSSQISALTWNLSGQVVLHDFLKLDIPSWLHRATIRIISMVPAFFCIWTSGAEGIYQLLIFTQVMVALLLPSSVIPLFRVASSRSIMGVHKISQFLEFLVLITFGGMLVLKLMFVIEMIFGNSDWAGNLRWNIGSNASVPFVVLLITACASLCLTLWLLATPLKSASSLIEREENDRNETRYYGEEPGQNQELVPAAEKSTESQLDTSVTNFDPDLPEIIMESDQEILSGSVRESCSNITFPSSAICHQEETASADGSSAVSNMPTEFTGNDLLGNKTLMFESPVPREKTVGMEGDLSTEKNDDGDTWDAEELSKDVPESTSSFTSDGPGSFRSLSRKGDESGNGPGSLSRLGLGRAARRQLASALDEFWGQLYDFHGQMAQGAKAKKLDILLGVGIDSKFVSSLKVDPTVKELGAFFPSVGGRGSDSMLTSSLYDSPKQLRVQNSVDSAYGVQIGSSPLWSNHMQLDAYAQNSSRGVHDSGERRYSSLRIPLEDSGERRYSSLHIPLEDSGERRYSSLHIPSEDSGERRYSSLHIPLADSGERQYSSLCIPSEDSGERRYSSLRIPSEDSGERRYSSLRIPSEDSGERRYSSLHTPSEDSGERRYSSLRIPSEDSSERRYSSLHIPLEDSGERRYSSLRISSEDSGERRYSSMRIPLGDSGERLYSSLHIPSEESGERRYSSLRTTSSSNAWSFQPTTVHGCGIAHFSRIARERNSDYLNGQRESPAPKSPSLVPTTCVDALAFAMEQKLQNGTSSVQVSGYQNFTVSRNCPLQPERSYYGASSSGPVDSIVVSANAKKFHSLPDISGLSVPLRDQYIASQNIQWDGSSGYKSSVGWASYEPSLYSNPGSRAGAPLAFDELSPSKGYRDAYSLQLNSSSDTGSIWSRQPFEQFGLADKCRTLGEGPENRSNTNSQEAVSVLNSETKLLQSFRLCILKLLKLEGSEWLFRPNDGADEDLINRVAAREKFLCEAEAKTREIPMVESQYLSSERNVPNIVKNDDARYNNFLISSVPNCGDDCVWKMDLIVSFGVWCIHRILSLSLMESRPELWGKYTYVLNRLQGVIDLAFLRPRMPMTPCFCLQIPGGHQQRSSPPTSNAMLPRTAKPGRGKCTTAAILLDIIKDVETAISCRKGRSGTAAGDVAFPKGKENLASVLKRYRRRLSNKPAGNHDSAGSRKVSTTAPYSS
ncbi:ethylene-insensitive protein 2-like [Mangifera indica]|uniref:ethylene-insensitive protein 2-like n=1 Tax=Mangifera indica TaxID=29780 RepID=UPI001CFB8CE0|nr:ethylene-insensitive protein 2-like [Mangifera indica]XP_044473415.1 ethylene-insensitive protein 2-like [Mangifera indica]XP_044473416.1 ethylene-insensitive protein 2-like [Mangifera indica]